MSERLKKILDYSRDKLSNDNEQLTEFFNKSSMAKLLDLFLNNPKVPIYTMDILENTGLSRKSIWINIPKLLIMGIITESYIPPHKFYKLDIQNKQVKQISELRDILTRNASTINNIIRKKTKTTNRRINPKHEPKRRTGQSKKVPGKV